LATNNFIARHNSQETNNGYCENISHFQGFCLALRKFLISNPLNMLLEFSVGNYLSFRETKTLSLVASPITEFKETSAIKQKDNTLLKGAIIYGANSSGKSNLIRAMSTMRRLVLESFEQSSSEPLNITPFLLNTSYANEPSHFEIIFQINKVRYRYGFEVTNTVVIAEWLYEAKSSKEKALFIREKDGIEVMADFEEGKNLESKTRDNALFVTVVDQFNGTIAKQIMNWFGNFIVISGLRHEAFELMTFHMLSDKKTAKPLIEFYKNLDLGFDSVTSETVPFNPKDLPYDIPESLMKFLIKDFEGTERFIFKTRHPRYDKNNKLTGYQEFDLREQESAGTNKIFNLSGPIFEVLKDGGVLVVDELDASLHPLMTLAITKLFNSAKYNPQNAQLIFATHDSNLLTKGNYRRDQVYFVEKDKHGASDLYSLIELREDDGTKIRKDRSFEKDYVEGRYGAIPYIGNVQNIVAK
jgi:AAA15 family ATPase/GTPase